MAVMDVSSEALMGALKAIGLDSQLQKGPEEIPFDQIIVPLAQDSDGKDMAMLIGIINTPIPGDVNIQLPETPYSLDFIQIFVPINVEVQEKNFNDTMKFLHMLNTFAELPGFIIGHQDKVPIFRYNLLCVDGKIEADNFVMTVTMILYVLDTYTDAIKAIAKGEITLDKLLDTDNRG